MRAPQASSVAKNFSGRPMPANATTGLLAKSAPLTGDQRRAQHLLVDARRQAGAVLAEQHHGVGAGDAVDCRLAQRARRHDAAIAEAIGAVDHEQRQILDEARVLEAVIHDETIGAGLAGGARGGGAVARHPYRRGARQQQRLVADLARRVARRIDPDRTGRGAAIAAAQDRAAAGRARSTAASGLPPPASCRRRRPPDCRHRSPARARDTACAKARRAAPSAA